MTAHPVHDLESAMALAIEEAETSLRGGDCGFGAVVVQDGRVVARGHDTERTDRDPTAHAEMAAIRAAARVLGRSLSGCAIVSTHEPCPMCATAILWAGIDTVAHGFSIQEALRLGRNRIDLPCREIFDRARRAVTVHEGVLHDRCAVLYDPDVRRQVDALRGADLTTLDRMADDLVAARVAWVDARRVGRDDRDLLETAYRLLLEKLGVSPDDAPVLERGPRHLRFASKNRCPTLEACRILGLDTRVVCRALTERPTNELLRRIHPGLRFSRDYATLRPHGPFCDETISLEE